MKLTNKEMAILSVFLSIVIIVAGLFLFILPEYEKIDPNRQELENARAEREQIYASLARESTIDQEIQDAIDQANTLSLCFYDDMTTYEADVVVREILEATNMKTYSLSLSSFTTSTLTVSQYIESVVTYPLKEYSGYAASAAGGTDESGIQYDEEGNIIVPDEYIEEDMENALKNYLIAILSTQSQTIGSISVSFSVTGTRGDFLNFLNYVADLERATIINSTSVEYTGVPSSDEGGSSGTPNEGAATEEGEGGAIDEGTEAPAITTTVSSGSNDPYLLQDDDEITAAISMTFYCVAPMSSQVGSSDETTESTEVTESEPEE